VQAEIQQAQSSLERQIEAYNRVHDNYDATKTKLQRSRELLGVAKANLGRAQKNLAASLTQAYKNGDNDDLAYLLASSSFSDLVDNVSVLEKASNASGQLLTTIAKYKKEVSTQEATLQTETAKLHQELGEMAQRKQAIQSQITSLNAREAQISSDIKRLIDEEQRRQDAAARAAAAAATGGGTSSSSTSSSTGGSIPIPPSGTLGGQAVAIAMQYLGTPYVWGGASPGGFDCSGLVMYVYSQLGVSLPHNAAAQYGMGVAVPRTALEPGDLVFFDGLGHVGIYVGNGAFIHAPHTGDVVRVSSLSGYYSSAFVGARRVG
jgi:cell wall-associated NlpC family hydrolase